MTILGVTVLVLMATAGATLLGLWFRPPQGDKRPVSRDTINHIIQLECKTTGDKQ